MVYGTFGRDGATNIVQVPVRFYEETCSDGTPGQGDARIRLVMRTFAYDIGDEITEWIDDKVVMAFEHHGKRTLRRIVSYLHESLDPVLRCAYMIKVKQPHGYKEYLMWLLRIRNRGIWRYCEGIVGLKLQRAAVESYLIQQDQGRDSRIVPDWLWDLFLEDVAQTIWRRVNSYWEAMPDGDTLFREKWEILATHGR
jgi:hypothetical protein